MRARTFVIAEGDSRIAYVSIDGGMASDLVKMRVVENLKAQLGGDIYTNDNLLISGTHTHSGPAGFLQYVLYLVTSLGFVKETFDAWVNGITASVVMAHNNMQDARIMIGQGELDNANINRSPTSYLENPAEERAMYDADTDKNMMLLKFVSTETNEPIGVLNWFAVHATSMNNTNTYVSGDNKGYAAYAMVPYNRHHNIAMHNRCMCMCVQYIGEGHERCGFCSRHGAFCRRIRFHQFGRCVSKYQRFVHILQILSLDSIMHSVTRFQ